MSGLPESQSEIAEVVFDRLYGAGSWRRAQELINELAPVTRRDDWWATDGPYEIIAKHLRTGTAHG